MKRFFSLLALVLAPATMVFAADAMQKAPESKSCGVCDWFTCGPVSAADESWASRVELGWSGGEHHHEGLQLNTIQPIVRSDDMRNTFFGQAGVGLQGHDKKAWDLGLGYRYLTMDTSNMFGANMFFNDTFHHGHEHHRKLHGHHVGEGYTINLEWLTAYTTLAFGRHVHGDASSFWKGKMWKHMIDFKKDKSTLDLSFQLPYLPWTTLTLGKDWIHNHDKHNHGFDKLNYILDLNLVSCLSLQMGYKHGWNKNQFVRLVLTFGRPAVVEHTMLDKFFSDEAFTARDLRNYTLQTVAREDVGLYR